MEFLSRGPAYILRCFPVPSFIRTRMFYPTEAAFVNPLLARNYPEIRSLQPLAIMAPTSLRPAFVLAVLLSLTCNAIAGRHLLQTSNTRYQSSSKLSSNTGNLFGSCTLDAKVTAIDQTTSLAVRVTGVKSWAPSISFPSYYRNSTGSLVAQFPCKYKPEATSGTWSCTIYEKVALSSPYQPVGGIESLVTSGMFVKPSDFYVQINVDGVAVEGKIIPSVMTS
ncbi:unnamed protein product [Closterium sp. Yama58-4]|nr:unnamed protein product [Closterium sp. Yama58-4]